jgi:hypothetical protein
VGQILSRFLQGRSRVVAVCSSVLLLGTALAAPAVWSSVAGNVGGSGIEIDAPNTANLYPGNATKDCANANFGGGTIDWVRDCAANSDTPSLVNSVATGLQPGVTSKPGGTGHWNGVRLVDGIAGDEENIFLTGGKENDVSTWNVGPGTVGSSKYDATQAYLANNQTDLFFGMERRGNNGTTAFDFEFNQVAPPGGTGTYIPTRTVNDVLLTFELNGSGSSGSASAHYFRWTGSAYVEQALPAGTVASINDSVNTPAAPWGHVSSKGIWEGGNFARFEFGEAKVPLSILPGVNACGGRAYVQLRTRSSATDTSDLKDTTKIFEYEFPSVSATAAKTGADGTSPTQTVTVTGSATGATGLSYEWQKSANGTTWSTINGATSSTLTYSSFEADDTTPTATGQFSIGSGDASGSYVGRVYTVHLRMRAYKTVGSQTCQGTSAPVIVKKVLAVDP